MDLLDCEVAQLAYEDRLRAAEQRHHLVLVFDMAGQPPVEGASGLLSVIKAWHRTRTQHREAGDTRRPHAV